MSDDLRRGGYLDEVSDMRPASDKSTMWNCLVGFRECSSSYADSYMLVMLEKLLVYEGVAVDESGVYLACDEDFQMIPSYLIGRKGYMAFEFMGESYVCTMSEGARHIRAWCNEKIYCERENVLYACNKLVSLYDGDCFAGRQEGI